MTRQTAILAERAQLDLMIELLGLDVTGEPVKRESPDFQITLRDGRPIGVEVVRAMDERIAGGRGARERLKSRLRNKLQAAGINAWVNVSLHENSAAALNRDRTALEREVEALVDLARRTMSTAPDDIWYRFEWIDHEFEKYMGRRRHGQREVQDLKGTGVERASAVGIRPWHTSHATWSITSDGQRAGVVQAAINAKVGDLATYRQCGAAEIWLLVVGSAGTGGTLVIEHVEDNAFVSPYDRTIFLELYEGRCIDLTTKPSP